MDVLEGVIFEKYIGVIFSVLSKNDFVKILFY